MENGIGGTLTIGYADINRDMTVIEYTTRWTTVDGMRVCRPELEREIIVCALRDYPDWQFVNWQFGSDVGCIFNGL